MTGPALDHFIKSHFCCRHGVEAQFAPDPSGNQNTACFVGGDMEAQLPIQPFLYYPGSEI